MSSLPLSKRALKRQSHKNLPELLLKKRAKRQAKRLEKQQRPLLNPFSSLPKLSHEPMCEKRQDRKRSTLISFEAAKSKAVVCVDASFEHLMSEGENKSLASQLAYAFNSNRNAPEPVGLHVCGFKSLDSFLGKRLKGMSALDTWTQWGVRLDERPLEEVYEREKLVYLSADSHNVLDTLEDGCVYVVGGIVDRNRHKGLCDKKAKELGIRTAKFPLDEYFSAVGFSRVLTTNHCVDILLEFLCCGKDWMQACKRGVPVRKLKAKKSRRARHRPDAAAKEEQGNDDESSSDEDEDDAGNMSGYEKEHDGEDDAAAAAAPVSTSTVILPASATKQKSALIFGGASGLGLKLAQEFFALDWSVFIVDHLRADIDTAITQIRAAGGPAAPSALTPSGAMEFLEKGQVAGMVGDCSTEGDVSRMKMVIDRRYGNVLDAVVLADAWHGPAFDENQTFLNRALPIRELHRTWSIRRPKVCIVSSPAYSTFPKLSEWTQALIERYLPEFVCTASASDDVQNLIKFLTN